MQGPKLHTVPDLLILLTLVMYMRLFLIFAVLQASRFQLTAMLKIVIF